MNKLRRRGGAATAGIIAAAVAVAILETPELIPPRWQGLAIIIASAILVMLPSPARLLTRRRGKPPAEPR